jgi:hypothetical protein
MSGFITVPGGANAARRQRSCDSRGDHPSLHSTVFGGMRFTVRVRPLAALPLAVQRLLNTPPHGAKRAT